MERFRTYNAPASLSALGVINSACLPPHPHPTRAVWSSSNPCKHREQGCVHTVWSGHSDDDHGRQASACRLLHSTLWQVACRGILHQEHPDQPRVQQVYWVCLLLVLPELDRVCPVDRCHWCDTPLILLGMVHAGISLVPRIVSRPHGSLHPTCVAERTHTHPHPHPSACPPALAHIYDVDHPRIHTHTRSHLVSESAACCCRLHTTRG